MGNSIENLDNNINEEKYIELVNNIEKLVNDARNSVSYTINNTMIETYWSIGKHIIEFEQQGNIKAEYGKQLLLKISKDLKLRLGRGFSRSNIYNMRKIYECFPIFQKISGKLNWSQLCEVSTIDDELERNFYLSEASKEKWNYETLKRQMDTGLYLKLALSKNKDEILALAEKGQEISDPKDVIKNIYTLDFLNLPDKESYSESQLEEKIIEKLEEFLLELGKGFTFVKRQYPMQIGNKFYHADIVFYHRILKCFVIIDLKIRKIQHEDIGQMNMYMGYFAAEENEENDNPPIGIILTKRNDELVVEYATYGADTNLFVSKYELYLPNKEELKKLVDKIVEEDENEHFEKMKRNKQDID